MASVALSTQMVEEDVGWLLRLRVLATRARLDREIAAGAPTSTSPETSLRAAQLIRSEHRRAVAAVLTNLVAAAEERQADPASLLHCESEAINSAREGIVELIALLRSATALSPRAVALASLLAFDTHGPVYDGAAGTSIAFVLSEIRATIA